MDLESSSAQDARSHETLTVQRTAQRFANALGVLRQQLVGIAEHVPRLREDVVPGLLRFCDEAHVFFEAMGHLRPRDHRRVGLEGLGHRDPGARRFEAALLNVVSIEELLDDIMARTTWSQVRAAPWLARASPA